MFLICNQFGVAIPIVKVSKIYPQDQNMNRILFLHGFASSGNNGTVKALRQLYPDVEIIAPDIPVEPAEALPMLKALAEEADLTVSQYVVDKCGLAGGPVRKTAAKPLAL